MKILFFVQHLGMGGVVRQLSILTDHLTRRGHDVSVVALYPIDQDWKLIWNNNSIKIQSFLSRNPKVSLSSVLQLIKTIIQLRNIIKGEKIQVLYSFQGGITRFIACLATRGIPNTKLIWGNRSSGRKTIYRTNWKVILPFYLGKWVSAYVPLMISNSEAGYNVLKDHGYSCMKQTVILNGIDVERFRPDPQARVRIRSEFGVIGNEKLIGQVGRLYPVKGYTEFLEAAALLAKEREDLRFVVIGDGPDNYKSQLQILSRKLGLREHLIWAGVREDMPAVYNALDILCSSSYGEGFSNVIGEAMACGVPCVVTDVGHSAGILGDEGIVVPPGDSKKLADGLNNMLMKLDDIKPHLLRERIKSCFGIETMVESTERALIEVYGSFN